MNALRGLWQSTIGKKVAMAITGLILVGDLFYERAASEALLDRLRQARRNGISVLIGDSSRPFGPRTGVRSLVETTVATDWDLEGVKNRQVRLLTLDA